MENGQDNIELSRPQTSNLFSSPFFAGDTIGWSSHANDASHDVDSNENGSPQRVLTRRQRAALIVGRTMGNDTAPVFPVSSHLDFGSLSVYGLPSHLEAISNPVTPSSNINLHLNPSANPADISPPARRSHARHSSDAFSPRASSPASSIATSSSSIASLLSYSTSTWSSTTGESSPARSIGDPKSKHTKNRLRNSDRKDMCAFAEQFPNLKQEDIAVKYGVERSTVSKVLKNKSHWLSIEDEHALKIIKHRPIKFPEVETAVVEWMHERNALGDIISDTTLREQARAIARHLGIGDDQFKASGGWIENFKQRHKIRRGKLANERAERGVSARRGSFSPGGEFEDGTRRRGLGMHVTPNGFTAADTYAQFYGSGQFRPIGVGVGSGAGGDDERESITSSAGSGSVYVDDDGGVVPMMADFSLAERRTSSRGMPPPPGITSNSNGSPRSSINRSPPRMFSSPTSNNNIVPSTSAATTTATATTLAAAPPPQEHGYSTRSKTINTLQLQQSVRMMSTFIRDVYPGGFTDGEREMWDVMERRTLEWAKAQKNGDEDAMMMMGDSANLDVNMHVNGEKQGRAGRTRNKGSNVS